MTRRPALPHLPRAWWSIDLPGYRDHPSEYVTYSSFPVEGLPPIGGELDETMSWLLSLPPVPQSLGEPPDEDPPAREATGEELADLLRGVDVVVPGAFHTFLIDGRLRTRVRSVTSCYLELPDFVVAVDDGIVVHFLSDQQWVMHWSLFIGRDGSESVVATGQPVGFRQESGYTDQETDSLPADPVVCAETFSEFIYRFRIENELWYALNGLREDRPLTAEERRYLDHYGPASGAQPGASASSR